MKIPHGVILASAGSGKTYRLSRRILGLLAHGAAPHEIVALTFTRKAAAEFVSRVLTTLATAAADTDAARQLARELAVQPATRPEANSPERLFFQNLLTGTVAQSHRLRFGTMDGFFQSLVRAHPLELGISGGFALLDERRARRDRAKRLRTLLRAPAGESDAAEFLESFRLASFGEDARGAASLLDRFATTALDLYRESGDASIWGDPACVWPSGTPWLPAPEEKSRTEAAAALVDELEKFESGHKSLDKSLRTFAARAAAHRPGTPVSELGDFATTRLLAPGALAPLLQGRELRFEYQKKERIIPAALAARIGFVIRGILAAELESRLRRTAGAGRLLARYALLHDADTLGTGVLGFADILHTLAKPENAPVLESAAYRLDGAARHWLFDEFQDTSRRAWRVLGACSAEAFADVSGERSVFLVGDTKQAIYAWNGGDHRLLPEITERHRLAARDLTETQRCGPEVIALVNAVCRRLAEAAGLPEAAAADWRAAWHDHSCAERALKNTGFARWVTVAKPGRDEDLSAAAARLAVVTERIREARFLERGLSVGVLTRTNAEATEAAETLRAAGIDCACETDTAPVRDNPVTLALLAAVRHAAHPGDALARETVAMSPLAGRIDDERLLRDITRDGVEVTLRDTVRGLAEIFPADPFSQKRVETLFAIAREYDASGERDASAFCEFAAATLRREAGSPGRVQVMTIHKSKGLEFDAVFLPCLEGDPVDSVDSGGFEAMRETPDAPPRAVLAMPPAAVCEADPVLRENLDTRRATAAYEQLCALYVALTRARRELTLISHLPPKRDAESDRASGWTGLLASAFELDPESPAGEVYAWGEAGWVESVPAAAAQPALESAEPAPRFPARLPADTLTPSALKQDAGDGSQAPGHDRDDAREFGTEVHRILQHLVTLEPGDTPATVRRRLHEATGATAQDTARHARAMDAVMEALRDPAFSSVFKPRPGTTTRTELPFTFLRDDGTLVSGTFDRLDIAPDGASALVTDFKTDDASPDTLLARYGDTLRLYREAAARLLGIPYANIEAVLLHLPTGARLPVP